MHILIGIIGIIFFLALAFCLALTEKISAGSMLVFY